MVVGSGEALGLHRTCFPPWSLGRSGRKGMVCMVGLGYSSGNVEAVGGLSAGEIGKELDEGCSGVAEKKMRAAF